MLTREMDSIARPAAIDAAEAGVRPGVRVELPRRHGAFTPPSVSGPWPPKPLASICPDSDPSELRAAVDWVREKVGWFHSVDLPGGVRTPGSRGWARRAEMFGIPGLVDGRRVLDLGAMEGGDTFHAESCGASVTAMDVDNYFGYDLGHNAAWDSIVDDYLDAASRGPEEEAVWLNAKRLGFELCRRARGSSAERISGSVYDLDPSAHGRFGVVFCFGLLYHLRHPLLALDRIRSVAEGPVLVNTQTSASGENRLDFFVNTWRERYTNWFVPTPACFIDLLSSSGFTSLEVVDVNERATAVVCGV